MSVVFLKSEQKDTYALLVTSCTNEIELGEEVLFLVLLWSFYSV